MDQDNESFFLKNASIIENTDKIESINSKNSSNNIFNNKNTLFTEYSPNELNPQTNNKPSTLKNISLVELRSSTIPEKKYEKINKSTIEKLEEEKKQSKGKNQVEENKEQLLIKNSAILKPKGYFSMFNVIKDIPYNIVYNYFPKYFIMDLGIPTKLIDQQVNEFPIQIFNMVINKVEQYNSEKTKNLINTILYMSFRNHFMNLNHKLLTFIKGVTSDVGWGCTIRVCQMMLSKGIIEAEIYKEKLKIKNSNKDPESNIESDDDDDNLEDNIDQSALEKIRKQTLKLFYDNYVPVNIILEDPNFQVYFKKFQKLASHDSKYQELLGVIPPFSLHTICDISQTICDYTSEISTIKAIAQINELFFNKNLEILFFEGLVSKKRLVDSFCERINNDNQEGDADITIEDIETDYDKLKNNYRLVKQGIIFISLRLGFDKILSEFIEPLFSIFYMFNNNIGFVGGFDSKAYYFIGVSQNNFLYLDPHITQTAVNPETDDGKTYIPKNIYAVNPKELCSQLMLGFYINNLKEFYEFMYNLKTFYSFYPYFIRVGV